MISLILISVTVLFIQHGHTFSSNATTISAPLGNFTTQDTGLTTVTTNYASRNISTFKDGTMGRTVLIIYRDKALRFKKATSLLYEERNEKGDIVISHMMYNLDDVAKFFETILNTKICIEECDADED